MSSQERHIGDELYGDRFRIATTEGVLKIEQVSITVMTDGYSERVEDSWWRATCPVCRREHESDGPSEDERMVAIEAAHDCCGAEWLPPQDWIEGCEVCGEDHREYHECVPPSRREPFPGIDREYSCRECDWAGAGEDLQGPDGRCPECETTAVEAGDPL